MQTTNNRRSVIVGLFIFVGLAIFTVAILALGGQRKIFVRSIKVNAVFNDVNGLAAGNNVWYSGVKIGTVKKITFLQHNQIEVVMNIENSTRQFIHKDVQVKVSTDGFVGNKIVVLSGGTTATPAVEDGDFLKVENALSTDEIMRTLQVNNKSLEVITGNLKIITKNLVDGQGTLGKLLTNDSVYNNLEATMATLRKTASNTQRLTDGLADYASKLQTKGALANDLVTDTVVFSKLRATATSLNAVASQANGVVQDLKTTTSQLNTNLNSNTSPAGVLLHDAATAEGIKQTIRNLESSTAKLDRNMEALQHNFLLRGFFRKEAKREKKEQAAAEKALQDSLRQQRP
ncbi:MlaD family protein [Chitinophaga nivalis]|uniref:MlaD family protein n=1 Tax=Chitinophaga nivalis TaxID=2991709 RepID=A0ABT3IGP3_9BACT|nr:MlaD family protein [Chitinophaga nivalis]MCW3467200.1 MlaD family protein [Chitinophaga nivalis]MCW3483108.1 MlaD family protein [Chitinophaga nivalis]